MPTKCILWKAKIFIPKYTFYSCSAFCLHASSEKSCPWTLKSQKYHDRKNDNHTRNFIWTTWMTTNLKLGDHTPTWAGTQRGILCAQAGQPVNEWRGSSKLLPMLCWGANSACNTAEGGSHKLHGIEKLTYNMFPMTEKKVMLKHLPNIFLCKNINHCFFEKNTIMGGKPKQTPNNQGS